LYDGPLGNQNELWAKIGVKALEMEVSTLLVIASLRGVRAAALLNVDHCVFQRAENNEDYNLQKQSTLEVC
jgi:uridine phosphorylase